MIKINKIIIFVLLVSIILSFCFVLTHIDHDCSHEDDCPICMIINNFNDNLKGFNPSIVEIIILVLSPIIVFYLVNRIIDREKYTLIGLKVELIN